MPDPHFANNPAFFKELTTATVPSSGQMALYFKTDGNLYKKDDLNVETAVGGSGAVVAVKVAAADDAQTNSSGATWVDVTGLTITYTPTSASNKILITAQIQCSSTNQIAFRVLRGATAIGVGVAAGSRTQAGAMAQPNVAYSMVTVGVCVDDSPATTSSTTWKIQMLVPSAHTAYINRTASDDNAYYGYRTYSTITLMEHTP
jgi:hypothetical protein